VAVRHEDVCRDEEAGAGVRNARLSGHVDAADAERGRFNTVAEPIEQVPRRRRVGEAAACKQDRRAGG